MNETPQHYHDTDSAETGFCTGCGRTDLRWTGGYDTETNLRRMVENHPATRRLRDEVWCSQCDQPATTTRQRGDETVAFCKDDALIADWKANAPAWKGGRA